MTADLNEKNVTPLTENDIQALIKSKQYHELINIDDEKYTRVKLISLIKLDKFRDALQFLKTLNDTTGQFSYEKCYILYKLKKYKKALKLLRLLEDSEKKFSLLSQVYYFLGDYNQAYETLIKCTYEKERDVNLCAMAVMAERKRLMFVGSPEKKTGNVLDKSESDLSENSNFDQANNASDLFQKRIGSLNFDNLKGVADYNLSFLDYVSYNQSGYISKYKSNDNQRISQSIGILLSFLNIEDVKGKKRKILEYNLKRSDKIKKEVLQKERGQLIRIYNSKSIDQLRDKQLREDLLFLKGEK
ncbi:hypothetical protein M153_10004880 [Pseudoloma neurophilia]|uniref:Tetratricopeptide repeat protein n=1 Tax=Pseudoloma neurophilia TaxID=146866 RepID=A0A0R0M8T3_9MICR|nr:hypothetical protein M153_10004880 [Pseudoloma neurophilia]